LAAFGVPGGAHETKSKLTLDEYSYGLGNTMPWVDGNSSGNAAHSGQDIMD
jgi:hypothetical protein